MDIIEVSDLPADVQTHELVAVMVAGANARASRVAPCLTWTGTPITQLAPSNDQLSEARLILIGAVKRWAETGSGSFASQTAGPFGQTIDTRQRAGFNLWPSEITGLQDICKTGAATGAFSVDTLGPDTLHAPWCALYFGSTYCSCGVDIAGFQIFEAI